MTREKTIVGKCKKKETENGDIFLGFIDKEMFESLAEKKGIKGTNGKTYVHIFIKKFKSDEADIYGNTHTIDVDD